MIRAEAVVKLEIFSAQTFPFGQARGSIQYATFDVQKSSTP